MFEYRLQFSKDQELRYLSHLELIRALERGLRRAQLPLVYSEGFHPHPKLSFGPALAVGVSSDEEYLDLQLEEDLPAAAIQERLNRALPPGLRILGSCRIPHRVQPLDAVINRAAYQIKLQVPAAQQAALEEELRQLWAAGEIMVTHNTKSGPKTIDIRPWLQQLSWAKQDEQTIVLELIGFSGSGGNLRPSDLISQLPYSPVVLAITRTGLWNEANGLIVKPFTFCQ